jgi:hypothetical protein
VDKKLAAKGWRRPLTADERQKFKKYISYIYLEEGVLASLWYLQRRSFLTAKTL